MATPQTTHPRWRARWSRLIARRDGRATLWLELLVIGWLLVLYDATDDLAPLRRLVALRNATAVLNFERSLHIDPELSLNRWAIAHTVIGFALSYYYVALHFLVTFGLLAWLWWKRPDTYRHMRTRLVLTTVIAFVVFWRYPLAPPRMLTSFGFQDVISATHAIGSFHTGSLATDANQYAAMPSLHVAWAAWSSMVIWGLTRRRLVRALALLYPVVTSVVVLCTGNHYLLDVLGGLVTLCGAALIERAGAHLLARWRTRHRPVLAVVEA